MVTLAGAFSRARFENVFAGSGKFSGRFLLVDTEKVRIACGFPRSVSLKSSFVRSATGPFSSCTSMLT